MKEERYGERDLCFSGWHRYQLNSNLAMTDLDCVEYCRRCCKPLALIELACDVGQKEKWTKPIRKLAQVAELPAYLVFYKGNSTAIKAVMHLCTTRAMRQALLKFARVDSLRIKQIYPSNGNELTLTPTQYQAFLIALRLKSKCGCYRTEVMPCAPLDWWNEDFHTNVTQSDIDKVLDLLR